MATIGELMLLWDIRDELKRANDIVEEERVRREWEKWDREVKEKVIERLRDPNDELRFSPVTYPDISKEKWADLIESGEVKIVAPTHLTPTTNGEQHGLAYMWADETREEAQRPAYRDTMPQFLKERVEKSFYRVIH